MPEIAPVPAQLYRYAIEPYNPQHEGYRRGITIIADDFEIYQGNMVRFTAEEICVAMFNLDNVGFHLLGEYHPTVPQDTNFRVEDARDFPVGQIERPEPETEFEE